MKESKHPLLRDLIVSSVKPGDEKNTKGGKKDRNHCKQSPFCRLSPSSPISLPQERTKASLISQTFMIFLVHRIYDGLLGFGLNSWKGGFCLR